MSAPEERRKSPSFTKTITLGNILTVIALGAGGIGVYTQIYADVRDSKVEIVIIKQNEIKKESTDREQRAEIRDSIKDVKNDVRDLSQKVDRILEQMGRDRDTRR